MQKRGVLSVLALSAVLLLNSCGDWYKIQRSSDWKEQFKAAMAYYQDEEYSKANLLLEIIRPLARGSAEAEQIEFYYGYSFFHQKQYILSAHYLKTFYDTYRRSSLAEEALFMHAMSLFEQSPNPNLDQTPTVSAIQALQNFLNRYPSSTRRTKAADLINSLQQKLEVKAFSNAKQYYTLERYEAAIISLENFGRDYPDSYFKEEASFLMFLSQFQFAKNSVPSKQKERYQEAVSLYLRFVDRYPDSQFARRAENRYDECVRNLDNIREQENS